MAGSFIFSRDRISFFNPVVSCNLVGEVCLVGAAKTSTRCTPDCDCRNPGDKVDKGGLSRAEVVPLMNNAKPRSHAVAAKCMHDFETRLKFNNITLVNAFLSNTISRSQFLRKVLALIKAQCIFLTLKLLTIRTRIKVSNEAFKVADFCLRK